jgi:hypothetical protein
MKARYYSKINRLLLFNSLILSKEESDSLIKEAKAVIRLGGKATEETLLGSIYLAAINNQ